MCLDSWILKKGKKVEGMTKNDSIDVLIVGAGPAGLSAGIYAARAGLSAVILEEATPGGQLASIDNLENYPGFAEGVNGFEVAFSLKAQAERFGARIVSDKAIGIELAPLGSSSPRFTVFGQQAAYRSRSVIVATGAKPVPLPVPGAEALVGKGISYCATCDGNFFRGNDVVVVGGGDSAVADVVYLSRIARTVHLVHRRNGLRASPWSAQRLEGLSNLIIHWDCVVTEVLQQDGRVCGVGLKNVLTGEAQDIAAQGVFVAIGTRPDTAWLGDTVILDNGYIKVSEGGATSVPGIFAAGDVRTTPLRQVVTAVSDGALAAEAAASFLAS